MPESGNIIIMSLNAFSAHPMSEKAQSATKMTRAAPPKSGFPPAVEVVVTGGRRVHLEQILRELFGACKPVDVDEGIGGRYARVVDRVRAHHDWDHFVPLHFMYDF